MDFLFLDRPNALPWYRAPGIATLAVLIVGLAALAPHAPVSAQTGGLFSPVEPALANQTSAATATPAAPPTLRSRPVKVDLPMLVEAHESLKANPATPVTLVFNLFDDVTYQAAVETTARTFSGGFSLSGPLVGEPFGSATVVLNGDIIAGSITTARGTYSVAGPTQGSYVIAEMGQADLLQECEVLEHADLGPDHWLAHADDPGIPPRP